MVEFAFSFYKGNIRANGFLFKHAGQLSASGHLVWLRIGNPSEKCSHIYEHLFPERPRIVEVTLAGYSGWEGMSYTRPKPRHCQELIQRLAIYALDRPVPSGLARVNQGDS